MPSSNKLSNNVMLWIVAIGFFMQTLDTTIVNTALPSMASSLGESPLRMQSVVIGYSLTMATMIPASGWLADKFGTRRIFILAIILFVLGSIACAASRTLDILVASRVLQGVGGAMLLPVGRLAVLRSTPRENYLAALSFVAMPGLIGPLVGPTLGGWLAEVASWHWIFLINVPVGAAGCIAAYFFLPNSNSPAPGRFDLKGFILLAVTMVALSLSFDGMSDLDLQRATVLVLLIVSMAALVVYALHATRFARPLFSLDLFKIHTYCVGLLGNLFARIGSGSMPYLIPLLLQVSLGYSPIEAGMMMLPTAFAGMLAKRPLPMLVARFGYRRMLMGNTVLLGITMASFALISTKLPVFVMLIQLAVFGMFNSMQFSAMNALTLKDLSANDASSGNSLFSMIQLLAMSLGVTVAGALLATFTSLLSHGSDGHALSSFHATFICMGLITFASSWIFAQTDEHVRPIPNKPLPAGED